MANRIIDDVNLKNIANAIRNKKGTANQMLPSQMANEISSIKTATSGSGIQVRTGTTTLTSIDTGLSSIDKFIMYSDTISSEGLVNVVYDSSKSAVTLTVCGGYNSFVKQCNVITQTTGYSVIGGTFQWTDNTVLGSFMHDATYNWIAVGS